MGLQELVSGSKDRLVKRSQGIIDQQMERETRWIEYLGKAAAYMLRGLAKHVPYHGRDNSSPRLYARMTALMNSPEDHNAMDDEHYQPSIPTTADLTANPTANSAQQ